MRDAGLENTLNNGGPYTVFAPTNEAFDKLPQGVLDDLRSDKTKLSTILTYHVVNGEYRASDLKGMNSLTSLETGKLSVNTTETGEVMVGNATVVEPDIIASNGVIHGIDRVLIPSGVAENQIAEANQAVVLAAEDAGYTTFTSLVRDAGLENTLNNGGPYTVFAPTNEAFDKLPQGVLDGLRNDKTKLSTILTYHVVNGEYRASDLKGMNSLISLETGTLSVNSTESGQVMVGNTTVVEPDIIASNGVIHGIDRVMMPSGV